MLMQIRKNYLCAQYVFYLNIHIFTYVPVPVLYLSLGGEGCWGSMHCWSWQPAFSISFCSLFSSSCHSVSCPPISFSACLSFSLLVQFVCLGKSIYIL